MPQSWVSVAMYPMLHRLYCIDGLAASGLCDARKADSKLPTAGPRTANADSVQRPTWQPLKFTAIL